MSKMTMAEFKEIYPNLYAEVLAEGKKAAAREKAERLFLRADKVGITADTIMTWLKKGKDLAEINLIVSAVEGGQNAKKGLKR